MSTAANYHPHYTLADYLQWDGDWELWHGTPVAMSPSPGFRHQKVAAEFFTCFQNALKQSGCTDCQVIYEWDWHIADDTVVRPDILLVCGQIETEFLEFAPRLITEVLSPSTAEKDRTAKRALYEQEQVAYYLLADPETQQLEIWQLDEHGAYQAMDCTAPCQFNLSPTCQITVNLPAPDLSE